MENRKLSDREEPQKVKGKGRITDNDLPYLEEMGEAKSGNLVICGGVVDDFTQVKNVKKGNMI